MRTRFFTLMAGATAAAILMVTGAAQQATAADGSAAPIKIGFIDSSEVLASTEDGKKAMEQLNNFANQKQQELATKGQELQNMQQEFTNKQATLNAETRGEMQRTIEERQRDLKRAQEDAQAEFTRRQNELLAKMSERIQVIIEDYAQKNSYTAIFYRDESQVWVTPTAEITQDIIRLYNEKHPPAAAAAAPAQ